MKEVAENGQKKLSHWLIGVVVMITPIIHWSRNPPFGLVGMLLASFMSFI